MVQESNVSEQITPIIGNRGRHRHDVPDSPMLEKAQKWMVHHNIEHLHGPEKVDFAKDELVVLVVLRDGRPYIKSFVEHYLSLGAKHLVFLDTGSEDGTIEALQEYESRVTVFRTGLPFKNYQISMRQYLVERFGKDRWTLSADIDELFDYPYSDVVSLKALLGYLREHRYTAVVCHMLDMFPEEISSDTGAVISDEPLQKLHRFYDTSDVQAYDYGLFHELMGNEVSNEEIEVLLGGVQKRLFKISPLLTKHPLVFFEDGVRPVDLSEHWVGGARIADFTGLFLHYKLSASLYGLVRREIEKRTYPNRHGKYDKYLQVLESATQLVMKDETSKELENINELVGGRFMVVSKEYMQFVGEEDRKKGNPPAANSERLMEAFFSARSEARAKQAQTNGRNRTLTEEIAEVRALRAENQAKWAQQQALNAEQRTEKVRQHADRVQQQILAMQSSRTWKTLEMMSRAKTALIATISVLKSRIVHRQVPSNGSESTQKDRSGGITDSGIVRDVKARLKTGIAQDPVLKTKAPEPPAPKFAQDLVRAQEQQISNARPELSTPPFFIVGSGKSGTTWLQRLLDSHPEILCLGEGRFFNRKWHREDLRNPGATVPPRTLYGALYNSEDLRLWLERNIWSSRENPEKFFADLTRFAADYWLKRGLAKVKGGQRLVGDKTPFLPGANVIEDIKEIYPEAKVIHVIRDGRDVEVSWIHHRWNRALDRGGVQVLRPGEIERREAYENDLPKLAELGAFEEKEFRRRASLWREQVRGASESGPRLMGDNYTEVRYESLLDNTAAEAERLLRFLGVESSNEVVRRCVEDASFERLSGGRQQGEADNLSFFRKGIAGDWRNFFTEKDKQIYKEAAGDLLVKLGYEKDNDW